MLRDPNIIGQKFKTNSGDIVTIIGGNDIKHLTVQFEDSTIKHNVHYHTLKRGCVLHPLKQHKHKKHIGEIFTTNSGDKFTIIDDKNATHITVQFEDGTIKKNLAYADIQKGALSHPSKSRKSFKIRIGETFITKSGYKATIINGEDMHNLTIQFEDGIIKNNINYSVIKKGIVSHPYLTKQSKQFHSIKLNYKYLMQHKYASYDCTCEICGKNMLLTPVGLMKHHLTCQKEGV